MTGFPRGTTWTDLAFTSASPVRICNPLATSASRVVCCGMSSSETCPNSTAADVSIVSCATANVARAAGNGTATVPSAKPDCCRSAAMAGLKHTHKSTPSQSACRTSVRRLNVARAITAKSTTTTDDCNTALAIAQLTKYPGSKCTSSLIISCPPHDRSFS